MEIDVLLRRLGGLADCELEPPAGRPKAGAYALPGDLAEFYDRFGGALIHAQSAYPTRILPPGALEPTDAMMWAEGEEPDLPTPSWFLVADDNSGNYVSIDLSPDRLGWCYDTQIGCYGDPGGCMVVARSFTEYLRRTLDGGGGRYYWLQEGFVPYGDAYDENLA